MAIITSKIVVGQKPPKAVIKRVRKIAWETRNDPPDYTPDCPELSPQGQREFAEQARARDSRCKAERIAKVANFFCRLVDARPLEVCPVK